MDIGFAEDRQFGRGKSGGQFRDEMRKEPDAERGNFVNNNNNNKNRQDNSKTRLKKRSYDFGVICFVIKIIE